MSIRRRLPAAVACVDTTNRHDSMAFTRLFARTDFAQTFTVTRKVVDSCSTALVLFDSTYTDSDGLVRLVIGLSWTHRHGRWEVAQDQNTVVD